MTIEKRNKLLVTYWGTRGSIPTPGKSTEKYGGNTTCLEVRYNGSRVILDAGTGIRDLGLELMSEIEAQGQGLDLTLLLTHTHWDHIQGLPFFAPAYHPGTKLRILGRPNENQELSEVIGLMMEPAYFPVDLTKLGAQVQMEALPHSHLEVGEMKISWEEQYYHPGGCLRYKIEAGGRSFVFSSDVELEGMYGPSEETQELLERRERYEQFVKDVDLLVADGQYNETDYEIRKGWGHTSIPTLLENSHALRVKKVAVFHHEPTYTDSDLDQLSDLYMKKYHEASPSMGVYWAREGVTVAV